MKKTVKTAVIKSGILAMILIWIAGCSKENENQRSVENENAVEQVLEQQIQGSITADENSDNSETDNRNDAEYENTSETEDEIGLPGVTSSTATASSSELSGEIDIDLIGMGSDMVYATVYQFLADPNTYVGKTIRMQGKYSSLWYEATEQYYHYVIIEDALACCASGIEFVWEDGTHIYPDEYPENGDMIEVVGVFETYYDEVDECLYCRLRDAALYPMRLVGN